MKSQRTALFHTLSVAAMGGIVTTEDVRELPIVSDANRDEVRQMRRDVLQQARAITEMRQDGNHAGARRAVREVAERATPISSGTPDRHRSPARGCRLARSRI